MVDDVHLLTDAELVRLSERVADTCATVVAAAEAYEQRPALRHLSRNDQDIPSPEVMRAESNRAGVSTW